MNPGERRAKEKARLREKILAAARTLFARQGCETVTMREIAGKIGYTATALYYHFPNKECLLRELCETDFAILQNYFKRLERVADPLERIHKISMAYVRFGLENPQHYRFMFMTPRLAPQPGELSIEQGNPSQDGYAFLLQTAQAALATGRLRPEVHDAHLLSQILWAGMHGVIALHLDKGDSRWVDWRPATRTAELVAESLLRGIQRD
jgi:AcrR family transcriptional regulator